MLLSSMAENYLTVTNGTLNIPNSMHLLFYHAFSDWFCYRANGFRHHLRTGGAVTPGSSGEWRY